MEITKEDLEALIDAKVEAKLKDYTQTVVKPQMEDVLEQAQEGYEAWIDDLIDEVESMPDADGSDDDDDEGEFDFGFDTVASDDDDDEGNMANDRAYQQLKRQIDQLKAEKEAEQKQREEAEAKAARDSMMNAAIEGISGTKRVTNSKHFLTALQTDGRTVEKDGQMFIKGKDKYGMDALLPLNETAINDLLATDYSHFDLARGGTGTGATPASGGGYSGGLKYFNSDGSPKIDPGVAMEKDRSGYLAEVTQLQKAGVAK
ncbi:hypothetical protein [Pantanalinema sp. GBBB05]|uniref:hypothetical protein n=1 Tax=Pantanalinema sp. GBBB05 TaxID=2604139 RepID=UPI001DEF427E|nr:hypothetical protein [Pantanalinema sp. GBBB05]